MMVEDGCPLTGLTRILLLS